MPPILVCSLTGKTLPVFIASVLTYAPWSRLLLHKSSGASYGESYNAALEEVFLAYDEVVISCDDVVLGADSLRLLIEDVRALQVECGEKLGLVAAFSDDSRYTQNIRYAQFSNATLDYGKWSWEHAVREVSAVSPLLCWMSKKAFQTAQFPPINWYSDDVICGDLRKEGFRHFISRAYVHHAGSQTIGRDTMKSHTEAAPWVREHRPDYAAEWGLL